MAESSEGSEPARQPKKATVWMWAGAALALVLVGVGAWTYTSTPGFCSSCHEIAPSVEGWRESAHAGEATCMECHAEEGFVGEAIAHLGGVQEAAVHFSESPKASDIRGEVPAGRCLRCHADEWDELPAEHPTQEAPCGVCHRDSAHTNEKPLFEAEGEGE